MNILKSKAGGKMTTKNGMSFEKLTNNEHHLIRDGYKKTIINRTKHGYYYSKKYKDLEIIYFIQNGFKLYMKTTYNIEILRRPDEAYMIKYDDKITIKILEKKVQSVEGTVELKLWSSYMIREEYKISIGDKFNIEYGFCLNHFFKQKLESDINKYKILKQMLDKHNIPVLYGQDVDYYEKLTMWINN
jgi:hypothetical protein